MIRYPRLILGVMVALLAATSFANAAEHSASIQTIRSVGSEGQNNQAAAKAWEELAKSDGSELTAILRGMQGANPIALNYLRAAFETIAQRELAQGGDLPLADLQAFLADQTEAPAARRVAFEYIVRVKPDEKEAMLAGMLNDRSLAIRYDAVAQALERAIALKETDKAAAIEAYATTLAAARNQDQIKEAAKQLRELGETVDLPLVFGMITHWKLIGPFDNSDGIGFAAVYPPEEKIDLTAKYEGKEQQELTWIDHATDDEYGMVDLNKALGKAMGAVGYAYHEFESDEARPAELRLGCICASKVWLNGELLAANEVYHSGSRIDQYVGKGQLQKGKNAILVKVCQNEQTENWAQDWQFQLRVCNELGTAILSQSRVIDAKKVTALAR